MKNFLVYLGIAVMIAATAVGQFTGIPNADFIQLAGFAIGLALGVTGTVKKAEKKDWKLYFSIGGTIVGAFILTLAGIAESTITSVISLVAGLVVIIVSLIPTFKKKNTEDKKA